MTRYSPESRQVRRAYWHARGYGLPVIIARAGKNARRMAMRDRRELRAAGYSLTRVGG
jgi:hypothetical protein